MAGELFSNLPLVAPTEAGQIAALRAECDELGRILAERLARLEALLEQITALNVELERRVEQRTAQLAVEMDEHTRAVRALRESEARYRMIAENSGDLIVVLDDAGCFVYVSPSAVPLLGYAPADLIGQPAVAHAHPDDLAPLLARWSQVQVDDEVSAIFRYRHQDGTYRWFDAKGRKVAREGRSVVVGRDITERRRLEAQLIQAQKMEGIGRLAGGAAHNFNNLLVVIAGSAQFAAATLPADAPAQGDLAEIERAVERASALTRQLLAFARRQESDLRLVAVNELLFDMHRLLRRLIREDIVLNTLPGADLWSIRVDTGQLEQVIVNLAVNACDSMPAGGRLTIETSNVTLEEGMTLTHLAAPPGPYVLIAVSDNGVGMPEEVQRHAFEPFFTAKEHGRGTGLGLATCYGIIAQHGGGISLYSEVGRGTTVRLYLPRASGTPAPAVLPLAPELPAGNETVLLVEDEAAVRELVARVLRAKGYTVIETPSAATALRLSEHLERSGLDLLLTDVVMPHMSGWALAEQLAAYFPGLRVLFMSGYTEHTATRLGHVAAGSAYLAKPFTAAALAQKVRAVLDA